MTITCQQCAFSRGEWMDVFTRAVLVCTKDKLPAHDDKICSRFEREPGTMEREDDEK